MSSVTRHSAGLLLFRDAGSGLEVLLGHMGGPFWSRRDDGGWSIPKGEHEPDEPARAAAYREFAEELGIPAPRGELIDLGEVRQSSGKVITVWALGSDLDLGLFSPGTFEMEWPRGSGTARTFPEIDRVAWWDVGSAARKLVGGQRPFLDRLRDALTQPGFC